MFSPQKPIHQVLPARAGGDDVEDLPAGVPHPKKHTHRMVLQLQICIAIILGRNDISI